jgi:hypothetical protein
LGSSFNIEVGTDALQAALIGIDGRAGAPFNADFDDPAECLVPIPESDLTLGSITVEAEGGALEREGLEGVSLVVKLNSWGSGVTCNRFEEVEASAVGGASAKSFEVVQPILQNTELRFVNEQRCLLYQFPFCDPEEWQIISKGKS